jgi:hypothetical protein
VRRLGTQLRSLPTIAKPSTQQLRDVGKYTDLATLWLFIDSEYDAIDWDARSHAAARTIHDVLMLMFCLREHPIVRPSCIRLLFAPGLSGPCPVCSLPACPGNAFEGNIANIRHFKTERSHGLHQIVIRPGSKTEKLLAAWMGWARAMLVQPGCNYLFINSNGDAFSPSSFYKYMPALLAPVAELGWTRVRIPVCPSVFVCVNTRATHSPSITPQLRHIVVSGVAAVADDNDLEGLAALMQTSVLKLKTVYHDNRRDIQIELGRQFYASLTPAALSGQPESAEATAAPPEDAPVWQRDDEFDAPGALDMSDDEAGHAGGAAPITTLALTATTPPPGPVERFNIHAALVRYTPQPRTPRGVRTACLPACLLLHCSCLPSSDAVHVAALLTFPRPQGRPSTFAPLSGRGKLTGAEYDQLMSGGGSKAVKDAFEWLYGRPTSSSNLKWVRYMLTGERQ